MSEILFVHYSDRNLCPTFLRFGIKGHTCDNEDQVRWPIIPEVVHAHARQFTSGLAHFWACAHESAPISGPILIKFGM